MICESLGAVWAVESNYQPLQVFVDYFRVARGCLGCRMQLSQVIVGR